MTLPKPMVYNSAKKLSLTECSLLQVQRRQITKLSLWPTAERVADCCSTGGFRISFPSGQAAWRRTSVRAQRIRLSRGLGFRRVSNSPGQDRRRWEPVRELLQWRARWRLVNMRHRRR